MSDALSNHESVVEKLEGTFGIEVPDAQWFEVHTPGEAARAFREYYQTIKSKMREGSLRDWLHDQFKDAGREIESENRGPKELIAMADDGVKQWSSVDFGDGFRPDVELLSDVRKLALQIMGVRHDKPREREKAQLRKLALRKAARDFVGSDEWMRLSLDAIEARLKSNLGGTDAYKYAAIMVEAYLELGCPDLGNDYNLLKEKVEPEKNNAWPSEWQSGRKAVRRQMKKVGMKPESPTEFMEALLELAEIYQL